MRSANYRMSLILAMHMSRIVSKSCHLQGYKSCGKRMDAAIISEQTYPFRHFLHFTLNTFNISFYSSCLNRNGIKETFILKLL